MPQTTSASTKRCIAKSADVGDCVVVEMSDSRIQKAIEESVEEGLQDLRMTDRKRRFMKEIVKDPSNPTQAAIIAGYSPKSAKVAAYRLMKDAQVQTVLAAHFMDHQEELESLLSMSLVRLSKIVEASNDSKFMRAFDKVLAYTKVATKVLGITPQISKKGEQKPTSPMDLRELLDAHRREIERITQLIEPGGVEVTPTRSGEEEVQH